jgi:Ca-activated chloride channel homolog
MKWGNGDLLVWLPLALPLAWIVFALLRRRRAALAKLVDPAMLPVLAPAWSPGRARSRLWFRLAALVLCAAALARPQWGFYWEEVRRQGLDLMIVQDTSRSMQTSDIKPSRLQQAKWGIRDLLRNLRGDRVGLVPFAGSSVLQCPLTVDYAALLMTLDDIYSGIIPRGGTAIEQALQTAISAFYPANKAVLPDEGTDRVILLITDGEDHEGDPLDLIPLLKEKGIRVYTIGIGTLEGELVPGEEGGYFKDRRGQIVKSAMREDVLQELALATGGTYVRSAPGDTGLERVFRESIQGLRRSDHEARTVKIYEDRFAWFLLAGLLLLAGEALLPDRRTPREEVSA